mmetsp:Transcript_74573/g.136272  ORF Transcript_74573/g.136272 Transcript_74573/m.136272 type:complete len:155 (+) Transcript_74573:47-511(+)
MSLPLTAVILFVLSGIFLLAAGISIPETKEDGLMRREQTQVSLDLPVHPIPPPDLLIGSYEKAWPALARCRHGYEEIHDVSECSLAADTMCPDCQKHIDAGTESVFEPDGCFMKEHAIEFNHVSAPNPTDPSCFRLCKATNSSLTNPWSTGSSS